MTTKDEIWYVVEKFSTEVAHIIIDLLNEVPEMSRHNTMKSTILHPTGVSEEKKLSNLFRNISIENRMPSHILSHKIF